MLPNGSDLTLANIMKVNVRMYFINILNACGPTGERLSAKNGRISA